MLQHAHSWCTGTKWFRCETCHWRGRLRDIWDPGTAFPDQPPLRIARELNVEVLQQRDEESLIELVLTRKPELQRVLSIWLDDSRPAPSGWLRVTTVASAKRLLEAGIVGQISLDYDLGWCAECVTRGEHLKHSGQRHCPHMPTGYDLVAWMAETGHWPSHPPVVHSGNMDGGARMLGLIAREWREHVTEGDGSRSVEHSSTGTRSSVPPIETRPLGASTVTTLSTCPRCGAPNLYRTHRRSNLERLVSMMSRRYPVRCDACGWTRWAKSPILVRVSPGVDVPTERIDSARLEQIDPD